MTDEMIGTSDDFASGPDFEKLQGDLAAAGGLLETGDDPWPDAQLKWLADARVLGWVIPRRFGGSEISMSQLVAGYQRLAEACLVTTFVLTQRNGACQRIAGCDNESLKARLLPPLCTAERFATVGVSHLTTSRQHLGRPAVRVEETSDGFRFEGEVPWVTGASRADWIVTGGTLDDGRQILAVIDTEAEGVRVQPAPRLLALNASQTSSVTLHDVYVPRESLVAGPTEQVMKSGRGGGTGSITTSALALGAAQASLKRLGDEAAKRPELDEILQPLARELRSVQQDLAEAAAGTGGDTGGRHSAESIRKRANSLVLRASQAYLAASKGAGFVAGHPAERAVREAMFFLVWSCPQPVLTAALREFACVVEP